MRRALATMIAGLALAGCDQAASGGGADPTKGNNAERYARDRAQCQAQVEDYNKQRRTVEYSRRDVFSDPTDRFGRSELPDTMAAYSDTKASDRMVERCLESRGWANQVSRPWWQRITG